MPQRLMININEKYAEKLKVDQEREIYILESRDNKNKLVRENVEDKEILGICKLIKCKKIKTKGISVITSTYYRFEIPKQLKGLFNPNLYFVTKLDYDIKEPLVFYIGRS